MTNKNITRLVADVEEAIAVAGGKPWAELDIPAKTGVTISLGEVRSAIAQLEVAKKALEEILRTKAEGEEAEEVAGFQVSTSPNRTFQKAWFAKDYPASKFAHLYKQEVDLAALKQSFAPVDLDLYYEHGEPRLNFKALS